jgi:plastocyanin
VLLLAGLSTGNKIGLAVCAAIFIGFALTSSLIIPKRYPNYPGKNGMSVFIIVCIVLFAGMLTAVSVFDVEAEPKGGEKAAAPGAGSGPAKTIPVTESEFKVALPAESGLQAGKYTFAVKNAGKIQHDLAITGPGVPGTPKTPLINAGGTAKLSVALKAGTYTLYCTVPGHRAAGMVAKLTVG